MHQSEFAAGFGNHNYGYNVMFHNYDGGTNENYNSFITYIETLNGKQDGIQIWSSGMASFRNVNQNFVKKKSRDNCCAK